jgi:N-acetylmuramoyl-L-alanine amidase
VEVLVQQEHDHPIHLGGLITMPKPNALLLKLATIYAQDKARYPKLKAVTLAQWMLESGRATSDLAKLHYNFGGLKWRKEMAGVATKVKYEAHDGVEDYCKFATIENFLTGYWTFLNRAPYSGWEAHTGTAEDFIGFIGPIYTPSPNYVSKVLALVPEAQALLDEVATIGPEMSSGASGNAKDIGVIVLDPGHGGTTKVGGSSPNNAISISGVKEKKLTLDFCLTLRDLLLAKAKAKKRELKVVLTRTGDVNVGIAGRAGFVKDNKAKLFLVVHFNGSKKSSARGVEAFFQVSGNINRDEDIEFCNLVVDTLVTSMETFDSGAKSRGVKPETDTGPGSLGAIHDSSMGTATLNPRCRAAYLELEFITNPSVETNLISGPNALANRQTLLGDLADEMLTYIETF